MLDENGYTPLAYDDALDIAQGTVRQYAGQNVDLSDGSFFGVWTQVYATMLVDLDQKEEAVYDSGLINFANGVTLDRLAGNQNLMRKQSLAATVTLSFVGTAGYVIPEGTVFMDDNGNEFYIVADLQLDKNGIGDTLAISSELGEDYNVDANTIINQQQPVEEITSVTNNSPASGGQDMETDYDFRNRILLQAKANESATSNGLYTALMNTDGVKGAKIVENVSPNKDSYGNPPYTIHFYVAGGTDSDVANTIWKNRAAGVAMYGSISKTVTDDSGISQTVFFDRPTKVPIYVTVTIKASASFDHDSGTGDIKAAVEGVIEGLTMGDNVLVSQFYADLYAIDGIKYASIVIGTSQHNKSASDIHMSAFNIATIDDDNIEVAFNG